jgi:hypothetical protein
MAHDAAPTHFDVLLDPAGARVRAPAALAERLHAVRGQPGVWTERRTLTLLSVVAGSAEPMLPPSFEAALDTLSGRHGGCRDPFATTAALVLFADPVEAVRVALQLQRRAVDLQLRMGLATLSCDAACIQDGDDAFLTVLGAEATLAAQVAASGTHGSIVIAPSTYALVRTEVHEDCREGLLAEEYDGAAVCASITPAPTRGGPDLSTFAGLGVA